MSDTTYKPRQTVIASPWLQDVNDFLYRIVAQDGQAPANSGLAATLCISLTASSVAQLATMLPSNTPGVVLVTAPWSGLFLYSASTPQSSANDWTIVAAAGGVGCWVLQQNGQITPRHFGAKGDGITDDTAAFAAADAWCRAQNPPQQMFIPAGTYRVSQVVVNINSNWRGEGRNCTVLQAIPGTNLDLIYGVNSNSNWGVPSPNPTGFAYFVTLQDLTLDGSAYNGGGTVNTAGSGIAIYGSRLRVQNIDIKNCAEHGIRTEYVDSNWDYAQDWYESTFSSIRIENVGKHGWLCNGPHDSNISDVTVINASRLGNNLWDGIYIDTQMSGRWVSCHASNTDAVKHRYAFNVNGNGNQFSGGCNIEGAYSGNLRLAAQYCQFDPSTVYYVPMNGNNIVLDGQCSLNLLCGSLMGPLSGYPACIGIVFASTATSINDNVIDVLMSGQEAAPIAFNGTADQGNNRIRIKAYSTSGAGVYGTPNTANGTKLLIDSDGGTPYYIDTYNQTVLLTIGATSTYTYTYPFPFPHAISPIQTVGLQNPGGSLTLPIWVSAISATSISIYNPNAVAVQVSLQLKGPSY